MNKKCKIFLLEDDQSFGSVMKAFLEMNDYLVHWISDGKNAISTFRDDVYDLCILDVMLPSLDGFSIAKEIKLINNRIPLIFLTAKTMKEDILTGYSLGADDYITKPFDTEVLLCKIKVLLSRHNGINSKELNIEYQIGSFIFNYETRNIESKTSTIRLSPRESDLLKMLCESMNSVLSREKVLKTLWGNENFYTARSMDVYIARLRKYFKEDPSLQIINIPSSGYLLKIIQ